MDADTLRDELEDAGELMVNVENFPEPLELHLHDTKIDDDTITLDLADGELVVSLGFVTGYWKHKHSLEDLGLH